jgi:hypothetical protein
MRTTVAPVGPGPNSEPPPPHYGNVDLNTKPNHASSCHQPPSERQEFQSRRRIHNSGTSAASHTKFSDDSCCSKKNSQDPCSISYRQTRPTLLNASISTRPGSRFRLVRTCLVLGLCDLNRAGGRTPGSYVLPTCRSIFFRISSMQYNSRQRAEASCWRIQQGSSH